MTEVPLGELIRPAGRRAGHDTSPPVYSVTKHAGFVPSLEYFRKQVFSRDLTDYRLVERGDFAYATIHLDEGSVGIAPERALISPMYTAFTPDTARVDPGYLIRFLRSPRALASYPQLGKGAVHRRKAISLQALRTLTVPLPIMAEQRRIAAILDHADALRAKRRQVLAHLDTLTRAIFHDMFCRTEDQWQPVHLRDVVTRIDSGTSPVCESRPATPSEWGVLKLGAVTYGVFNEKENKAFLGDVSSMRSNEVHAGDLLMTRKNTRELVGALAVVDQVRPQLLLPDLVFRLLLDEGLVDRYFLQALLMGPLRHRVRALSSGSAASMPNISKTRLLGLSLPLPPLTLQHVFARRLREMEKMRKAFSHAELIQGDLFASLQSRAFRGEL